MELNILPALQANGYLFERLISAVSACDIEAYLVGGFIRDYVLDTWNIHTQYRKPHDTFFDIDVAVVGEPFPLAEHFARLCGTDSVAIYENFGTAVVKVSPRIQVEFAMTRSESYREQSRKPLVQPASLSEDAHRRDFAINALYAPLFGNDLGKIWDPANVLKSLWEYKIAETAWYQTPNPNPKDRPRFAIRTAGNDPLLTFKDDPLRMFRAARFAAVLGFDLSTDIKGAIQTQKNRLEILSKERIADELNKTLLAWRPSIGFYLLSETGLLALYLPELQRMRGVDTAPNGQRHKDNFIHTLKVVDNLCLAIKEQVYQDPALSVSLYDHSDCEPAYVAGIQNPFKLWLRWAALLHDIAKPLTKRFEEKNGWTFHGHEDVGARKVVPEIFKRLRLPMNEKLRYVQKLVQLHQRPISLVDEIVTDSAIRRLVVDADEDLEDLLVLCRADITSKDANKVERYRENYNRLADKILAVEARDQLRNWQPPITGEIIMQHFQLKPGPLVGKIKNIIREAILEGDIPNEYDAAFALMIKTGESLLAQETQST